MTLMVNLAQVEKGIPVQIGAGSQVRNNCNAVTTNLRPGTMFSDLLDGYRHPIFWQTAELALNS